MQYRKLGQDFTAPVVGLGCMGMSEFYGPADEATSLNVMAAAVDRGASLFDTADTYGLGHNEELIGRFLKNRRRDDITLATKFGIVRNGNEYRRGINNAPAYARAACEASLQRLGVDEIDLYYVHRIEKDRPIEDVMNALADLVKEGKIRHIGLSEVNSRTLRRAHAVHPITALQSEYSLWTRDPEDDILETCRELGIGFVAYSPLGRGFLTGAVTPANITQDDFRKAMPRFDGENYERNLTIVRALQDIAAVKGCTAAQLALAWLFAQGRDIVAIPGMRKIERLDENIAALDLTLSADELAALSAVLPEGGVAGARYTEEGMKGVNA